MSESSCVAGGQKCDNRSHVEASHLGGAAFLRGKRSKLIITAPFRIVSRHFSLVFRSTLMYFQIFGISSLFSFFVRFTVSCIFSGMEFHSCLSAVRHFVVPNS